MSKIVTTFYPNESPILDTCHSWEKSKALISSGKYQVHTTQMGLLNLAFDLGHVICIMDISSERGEARIGTFVVGDILGSGKILRKEHNLFKLFTSGALDFSIK